MLFEVLFAFREEWGRFAITEPCEVKMLIREKRHHFKYRVF